MSKLIRLILSFIFTFIAKGKIGSINGPIKVNFYSRFTKFTHIGSNCHFNGLIVRGKGDVFIGDNFHSGKDVLFINSYHKYDDADAIPYDTKLTVNKRILIGDNVWLGDRVLVLGGVEIGEGSIIQAGSVVVSDVPKFAIAGGNPAKVFKSRKVAEYNKLKNEKMFC